MTQSHPPRTGAGDDRRQQVREARRQQAVAAKRRRLLTQVGVIAAVAVLAIGIVTTAVLVGGRPATSAAGAPSVSTTVPLAGTETPLAVEGSAVRLGPADAKTQIDLWVDYSCPHCQEYEAANSGTLSQLVAGGDVAVRYHNVQFVTGYGTQAGGAAACVAAEDPDRWPALNTALYANHSAQTDGWGPAQFRGFAEQQGVNAKAQDCISQSRYTGWIAANTADAAKNQIQATPTMLINGQASPTLGGAELTAKVAELAAG